ncbi:MAG: tetratricopeptide repeat protein [Phycisphaerae bacterium]|nr:tetratricopeptide repeat protein [Phycisphaerae bacterium]
MNPLRRRPRSSMLLCLILAAVPACTLQDVRRDIADFHVSRGERAAQRDDLDAALREYEAAIRMDPQTAPAYTGIGHVYRRKGQLEKAVAYFAEAIRLDPSDFLSAFSLGEVHQVLAAKSADRTRRLEAAIRAYLHACAIRPDNAAAYHNLGLCCYYLGRYDAAAEYLEKAVGLNPQNAHVHINLGAAYEAQQKYYQAIHAYKSALECDTQQPIVHVNLGTIYLQQGRLATAINSFEMALKMDPKLAVAHERLAYCRYREQKYDEALSGYDTAIELDPRHAAAYEGRGVVQMTLYLKNRNLESYRERALEDWHLSLEINPAQPRLRDLLARYQPAPSAIAGDISK